MIPVPHIAKLQYGGHFYSVLTEKSIAFIQKYDMIQKIHKELNICC